MCGLFGMILPHRYPTHLLHRGQAITLLGLLAEERGQDAAGVAFRPAASKITPADHWTILKATGTFSGLAQTYRLPASLATARVAMGHTRAATQGDLSHRNASPAVAQQLVCTHNGDLDAATIPYGPGDVSTSITDSAVLFAALATAHGDRVNTRRILTILTKMHGRAALAWADMTRPDGRVWLARAGLSPLAVGVDVDGGLWWASNPAWLRRVSAEFDLPFRSISAVPEGTLMSATPIQSSVRMRVHARFKPTVRVRDQRMIDRAVWRNFTSDDRHADLQVMRHRLLPDSHRWPSSEGSGERPDHRRDPDQQRLATSSPRR